MALGMLLTPRYSFAEILSDDQKLDVNRNIHQQTMEELTNSKLEGIYINFFVVCLQLSLFLCVLYSLSDFYL
jgi:hypothetical protein